MEPPRQAAEVFSRPDLVLEILRHLPVSEKASAATVSQIFAAVCRDDTLWRADLPSWWAVALDAELGRDARAWRNSALALHVHFPAALTLEPLMMARRAISESTEGAEEETEHLQEAGGDEKSARILNRLWRLASLSPSAWWHDLILSKTLFEIDRENIAGDVPSTRRPCVSVDVQRLSDANPSGVITTAAYHWHGMIHFQLARATWRRGHWRRAIHHFRTAVTLCPSNSKVLAGLGMFLYSCPVPGGKSGCNLPECGTEVAERNERRIEHRRQQRQKQHMSRQYDVETARKSIELALQNEGGLGWEFSEMGEERLVFVMSQLESEDGFSPTTARTSDQDWQDDRDNAKQSDGHDRHDTAVASGRQWLPARWEINRPPWDREPIRVFNSQRDVHFRRPGCAVETDTSSAETARNDTTLNPPAGRISTTQPPAAVRAFPPLDETTVLEAVGGQHSGSVTPQFATTPAAGHGGIFAPDTRRQLFGQSWVRVDQYDVIEALCLACCIFEVEGEQTGLSTSIGDLSVALRCLGDTSWALRAAQKALGLMARQRRQHEQEQQQQRQDAINPVDEDVREQTGSTTAAGDGLNGTAGTMLSLQFACAVVYSERAHQAHNSLIVLCKDYPKVVCSDPTEFLPCLKDTTQTQRQYQQQHIEGKRHMEVLLRHFSAEACGTLEQACAATGNVNLDYHEREFNWQNEDILQDPTVPGGHAMVWTERHKFSLDRMNHYFAQALRTSKQLSAQADATDNEASGASGEEGREHVEGGKNERERAVLTEWVHSLCDAGQFADAKRKLKELWSVLEGPLEDTHGALGRATCSIATSQADVHPSSDGDIGDKDKTRWRGIDRHSLELLEEEMNYLLLKAKLDESTPWPLSTIMDAADVDAFNASQEPQRPSSSLAALEGFERAVGLAKTIAQYGPTIQCLKRPIPAGCFELVEGRFRPVVNETKSSSGHVVLASGDDLRDVLETCRLHAHVGPQARALRELSRSHQSLYNSTAAIASAQQCLQLVGLPWELMRADSSRRLTDELTGDKQPLIQLGPPGKSALFSLSSGIEFSDEKSKERSKSGFIGAEMDMRVLGPGSSISVGLDDDDDDACARRQQLLDVCAGAIAESHTLVAQVSQRNCDYATCERCCKAALEIAPRLPDKSRRWVEMLAIGTRGDSALTRGDLDAALIDYRSALEIATSVDECLAAAAAELQLAEVERRRENSADITKCRLLARSAGQKAARSGVDALRTVAAALRTSASASIMANQYETARRQLQAYFQLILKESPPWWSGQSSAWHVLGTLCAATGEWAAAVGHWRRGLVLASRASDPLLTAIHTRDILKYTGTKPNTDTTDARPPALELGAMDRERLLTSGLAAAKKTGDASLLKAFAELRSR